MKRVRNELSLFNEHRPELCKPSEPCGHARVIECDGETDVIECSKCGKQRKALCSFDDDYS